MRWLKHIFKDAADSAVIPADPEVRYIDGYYDSLESRASELTGETIYSSTPGCLAIFDQILFEKAKSLVCILNPNLDERIYGQPATIMAAIGFLKKQSRARLVILLERDINLDAHPMIKAIESEGLMPQVQIVRVPDNEQNYMFSLIATDGRGYRFQASKGEECEAIRLSGDRDLRFRFLQKNTGSSGSFGDTDMLIACFMSLNKIYEQALGCAPQQMLSGPRLRLSDPADGSQGPN